MCGIFGYAGPVALRAAMLLQSLAIEDEVRGRHSTGLAIAARERGKRRLRLHVVKQPLSGQEFVRKGHTNLLFKERFGLAIGHNRFATAGAVSKRNAHPFVFPVGKGIAAAVHNGMVGEKDLLSRKFGVRDYPVDSEVMFRAIASRCGSSEESFVSSVKEVIKAMGRSADYACLWLDPARKAIYFWRSNDRPLVVVDARRLGFGRWFASTVNIFSDAWGAVRGALGSIRKTRAFEAKPFSIYRVADDGRWEVERICDVSVPRGASSFSTRSKSLSTGRSVGNQSDFWQGREAASASKRTFICDMCGHPVDEDEVVSSDPTPFSRKYHPDCAQEVA